MNWQRRARIVIAIGAVAFAIVLFATMRQRVPEAVSRVTTSDPKAVVESSAGFHSGATGSHRDYDVAYDRLLTFQDGSSKMVGIKVGKDREDGRHFTMSAREADVSKDESDFSFTGAVQIAVSDGMMIRTEHATFKKIDGMVRAPGPVDIARGRMTGSSMGLTYNDKTELLTLIDHVALHMAPDTQGAGAMDVTGTNVTFDRIGNVIHFDSRMKATHGKQVVEADSAVAHLRGDGEQLDSIELRGNSHITGADGGVGGFRSLTGRDVDLKYGPDGQSIEHALVTGAAVIQLAGEQGHAGRRISANVVDFTLAPDGSTPTALTAHDTVQLMFPAEAATAARTINAQLLIGTGDAGHGLTGAHFEGAVDYRERGPNVDRRARSQSLDAALGPGLSSLDDAVFEHGVRFEDGTMVATAARARYVLDKGTLELSGVDPASGAAPRLDTKQMGIDAATIGVVIDGPLVKASGSEKGPGRTVHSLMKRQTPEDTVANGKKAADTKLPAMLKKDQDVIITAGDLDYNGTLSTATYTGRVVLTQGDTSIKAASMTIDSKNGDLSASGDDTSVVATSMIRQETGLDKKVTRTRSNATSKTMAYEDASHRLTYTGDAHLADLAGDMTAGKIELYLKSSGDDLDRVEAYDNVVLKEPKRKTTGSRLTYLGAEEQYLVSGTLAHIVDACGQDTSGKTVTLFRSTERVTVDGADKTRSQVVGSSSTCP